MFICGGAFAGLDKVIRNRSEKGGIGFGAEVKSKEETSNFGETLADLQPEDLVQYGLIPEFVGRLPIIATLEELDAEALIRILTEPRNALTKQYAKMFEMEGVEIDFRDDGLQAVAERAMEQRPAPVDYALSLRGYFWSLCIRFLQLRMWQNRGGRVCGQR